MFTKYVLVYPDGQLAKVNPHLVKVGGVLSPVLDLSELTYWDHKQDLEGSLSAWKRTGLFLPEGIQIKEFKYQIVDCTT